MSRLVEAQAMEDVESTGSVPSPQATVTKETPASGSRMMRAHFVSPKPRYTSLGTLQSGVSKREPRVKTSEPIQKKLAQLQRQVSEVTTPLTQHLVGPNVPPANFSAADIGDGFASTVCRYCSVSESDVSRG